MKRWAISVGGRLIWMLGALEGIWVVRIVNWLVRLPSALPWLLPRFTWLPPSLSGFFGWLS